jgi:hypothetical protein
MVTMRRIFYLDPNETRWTKILTWWEIRRPLYNLFLLIFLAFVILVLSKLPNHGYIQLQAGPVLALTIYVGIVFYFIIANVCYTGGLAAQLIFRSWKRKEMISKHILGLFLYGLICSFFVSVVPIFVALGNMVFGVLN